MTGKSFQKHSDLHAAEVHWREQSVFIPSPEIVYSHQEQAANYEATTRDDEQLARLLQAEQEDLTVQDADMANALQSAQEDSIRRRDEELAKALQVRVP